MKKKILMIAGAVACSMMVFSLQANEAKESSVLKVWNGFDPDKEETRDHPKCPKGEMWTQVEKPDGSYKWECRHWLGEEE